ncbi:MULTISPECIES: restriction endonuclease subunit S [unclassified Bradyrhizobium]|uniref:restriction endonuclease subunit S n=1 Tax=unclassified Bradyrhizobium TaxID=2631580 RepID=UPI002916F1D1|nr:MULTISPECIES: restriction endonuclease subunit S [unclassified Bradyrhizobium]
MDVAIAELDNLQADSLPTGWSWTTLGSVLPLSYGKALPERMRLASGRFPVYGSSGPVGKHVEAIAPPSSIIVGRKGSAGAVFYSEEASWPIDTAYFTAGTEAIDIRYGYWFLQFRDLGRLDQSTAIPSLSRDLYNPVTIPLAPLPEQRRIVARIDELFAEIAAGEAALADARKGLETFRRALLKAAATGELTNGWRDKYSLAEPRRTGEPNDGGSNSETTSLANLPQGWRWTKVGDLLEFVTSGSRGWKQYYANEGAIFVRAQNINSGILDLSDVAFVRLPPNAEGLRTRLRPDDILVTITGANVTVSARVTEALPEAYVNQHVALLRPKEPEAAAWILLWLQAYGAGKSQLEKAAYGAGKPGLNLDNIREVEIAVPSHPESIEILRRVSAALLAADETLTSLESEAADAARLKQAILKSAFEGRLVPQDPADEPASALLARIAAERAAEPVKRGRGKRSAGKTA